LHVFIQTRAHFLAAAFVLGAALAVFGAALPPLAAVLAPAGLLYKRVGIETLIAI